MLLQSDTHLEISPNTSVKIRQAMLMLQEDHMKEVDVNRFEDNEVNHALQIIHMQRIF